MFKEIGSEFWDIPLCSKRTDIFPSKTRWYLSGRIALAAIIQDIKKDRDVTTVGLPSWCCESIIVPFLVAGLEVSFYSVTYAENRLITDLDSVLGVDVLLVMDNYFGYHASFVEVPCEFTGIVIRDITHSVFGFKYGSGDYYFGSLRKWCGFTTGGFAWASDRRLSSVAPLKSCVAELRRQAQIEKKQYIDGKSQNKDYYERFLKAEKEIESISKSGNIISCEENEVEKALYIDVDYIKNRRRKNAEQLIYSIKNIKSIEIVFPILAETDCPLFVPILVESRLRDGLRKSLIENNIFCPIHWPISKYHKKGLNTDVLYKSEISLVCDQRYESEDIQYLLNIIDK